MPSGSFAFGWMPGFVSVGPPPRFTGLPLYPDELERYNDLVAWYNKGSWQVLKSTQAQEFSKLYGWNPPLNFFGPTQAWASMQPLLKLMQQRFAERAATLPPNASSHQDQYTHDPNLQYFQAGTGYPWLSDYGDEYGRKPEGKAFDLAGAALGVLAIVAPYVPVIGPELAFVVAIAQGKSFEDAALAGIRAALPGGPAAQMAFDVGIAVAMGEDPQDAALQALWNQYPEGKYYFELGKMALGGEPDQAALTYLKSQPGGAPVAQALIVKNEEENTNKIDWVLPIKSITPVKSVRNATTSTPAQKETSERNFYLSTVGGCVAGAGAGYFAGRHVAKRGRRAGRMTGSAIGAVAGLVLGGIIGGVAYKVAT